jgi:hypothetical protein
METRTAHAGNQPVAAAEEASRAATGRVWATFMIVFVGGRCLDGLGEYREQTRGSFQVSLGK